MASPLIPECYGLCAAGEPTQTLRRIAQEADEVVFLESPEEFWAVGQFFDDFSQVSDEEVIAILQQSRPSLAAEGP